jgi:hypothetical protein
MSFSRAPAVIGLLAAVYGSQSAVAGEAARPVEVVRCQSDGQLGPQPPPTHKPPPPSVPASYKSKLAYYTSTDLGVLAPKGWRCFGLYGSNGSSLVVTPEPYGPGHWPGDLKGPAVQLSHSLGDTSGRFTVAQFAARLFPARRDYVEGVIREGVEPRSAFPTGPIPGDQLRRLSPTDVEFTTPPHEHGIGAKSLLQPNQDPIHGAAIITTDDELVVVDVRLPRTLGGAAPPIIAQVRREAGRFPYGSP